MYDSQERRYGDRFDEMFVKASLSTSHQIASLTVTGHGDESWHTMSPCRTDLSR